MNQRAPQTVRKLTPKHLGRRTPEEQAEIAQRQKIHTPRNLRKMLEPLNLRYDNEEVIDELTKTFKHWLMDCAHERRMKGELDEQNVIERLIEMIDDGKPYGTPPEMLEQIARDLK